MYTELKNQFDPLDIEIMEALQENARIPFTQLADQLKVSNSFVHQRVRKLRAAKVLRDPIFPLRAGPLGYETCAFTMILLKEASYLYPAVNELKKIPEIVECNNISGRYAIMVKIYAVNNNHLRDVVYDKIQAIDGIEGTNTFISFETAFSRDVPLRLEGPS